MSKIKKPIYGPPEIDEEKMTKQEIAKAKRKETLHKIRERKIRKAFKTLRFRGLKNFLFWFFGVFSSIAIIFGSVFIGVKVIPIGTYTKWAGKDSSEYVSEKIAEKSIFDAFMGLSDYTFSDVPAVEKFVTDILAETGVDDFVVVDYDALKNVKFMNKDDGSDLIDEVSKCIKLNTEAKMFSEIKAFTEYQATDSPFEDDQVGGSWVAKAGISQSHYCYAVAPASGNQPMNTVGNTNTQVAYADVFVNGKISDALKDKTPEQMAEVEFFYKPVSQLPLLDVVNGITDILGRIEITDVLTMVNNGGEVDPLLNKIFGGKSINNLISDLDVDGLLDKLMISDLGEVKEVFGQLGGLPVFSEWKEVTEKPDLVDNKIPFKEGTEDFTSNPKLYYYKVSGTHGEDDAVYAPAFSDDGVREEGIDDETPLYYPNLTEVSFSRAFAVIGDSIGTLEMTELLSTFISDLGQGDLIYDILAGTKIGELGTNFNGDSILEKITLGTIGGTEALGDLGSIIAYKEWREVKTMPLVEEGKISADFDPSVYYYLTDGTHGESDAVYAPAFNTETGERKAEVTDSTKLYYQSGWEIVLDALDTETVGEQVVITKDGDKFTSNPRFIIIYLKALMKRITTHTFARLTTTG